MAPVVWLSPLSADPSPPGLRGQNGVEEPGRSRLMSQNGSIVVETPLGTKQRPGCHVTRSSVTLEKSQLKRIIIIPNVQWSRNGKTEPFYLRVILWPAMRTGWTQNLTFFPFFIRNISTSSLSLHVNSFFSQFALKDHLFSCKNTGGANSDNHIKVICSYWHTQRKGLWILKKAPDKWKKTDGWNHKIVAHCIYCWFLFSTGEAPAVFLS